MKLDVVFETITSTYNSNGHGIGSILTPMTTFTFPHNVTVGETFFINYTIDWVDENGTDYFTLHYILMVPYRGSAIQVYSMSSFIYRYRTWKCYSKTCITRSRYRIKRIF